MSPYLKGGIFTLVALIGLGIWYWDYSKTMPSTAKPAHFELISQMETEGAPDFTLKRLDGVEVSLNQFQNKVVILNFWASWCDPCVQEFPSLMKLVEHFKGNVILLAVSGDDNTKDIENFLKAFGLPRENIEIVWDEGGAVRKLYGVDKIPESFLLNQQGKLIRKVVGIDDWYTPGAIAYFTELVGGHKMPAELPGAKSETDAATQVPSPHGKGVKSPESGS